MVTIPMLWAPIVLSTVLVFLASFLIWSVLPWHKGDYRGLPDEEAVAELLRRQDVAPGQYSIPYAGSQAAMKDPEFVKRMEQGPVGFLTLTPPRAPGMGRSLGQWAAYVLLISLFVAYLASRTLAPDADYLRVFRVAGTVAVLAYSAAVIPSGIWFGRPWGNVWKDVLDGVVYGLLTAGTFGWLWPR
ncbi:MAG: hypothetical protein H0V09_08835 [Gemmatimonadetes bacterium]|nr:hypothetical protein [Gemmatimonadota bacterium]